MIDSKITKHATFKLMRAYTKGLETTGLISSLLSTPEKHFVLAMWQSNVMYEHGTNLIEWTRNRVLIANAIWIKIGYLYDPGFEIPDKFFPPCKLKQIYEMKY